MAIPKVIHYCWFGGNALPDDAIAYIESWKRYCPDYEIRRWDESNFDFSGNRYAKEAAEAKKWAFVSDYVRLVVLYEYGGIYMDTDVEVLKSLDEFLDAQAFAGFESDQYIGTGILGAEKRHPWLEKMLGSYKDRALLRQDGSMDMTPNTRPATALMVKEFGLVQDGNVQVLCDGIKIYPADWFSPKDWRDGVIRCTENTRTIHHYAGSWGDAAGERFKARVKKLLPIFGEKLSYGLAYLVTGFEKHGFLRGCRIAAGRILRREKIEK